jgi:hypothetical protein
MPCAWQPCEPPLRGLGGPEAYLRVGATPPAAGSAVGGRAFRIETRTEVGAALLSSDRG